MNVTDADLAGGRYLNAKKIGPNFVGVFHIKNVEEEDFREGRKFVVVGDVKTKDGILLVENVKLPLNQVNLRRTTQRLGKENIDMTWKDKILPIQTEYVTFQGQDTLAIRVRVEEPVVETPTCPPQPSGGTYLGT